MSALTAGVAQKSLRADESYDRIAASYRRNRQSGRNTMEASLPLYRKNIATAQQIMRMGTGIAAAACAFLAYPYSYLAAGAALVLGATGVVGFCPFCALARNSRTE